MDVALREEHDRLVRAATEHADAELRALPVTLQLIGAAVVIGLAPLLPHADDFLGETTPLQGMLLALPCALTIAACAWLHRRAGPWSPAYQAAEAAEVFCLYGLSLGLSATAGRTWTVAWVFQPMTAAFWAFAKPAFARRYGAIFVGSNVLGAAWFWWHGRPEVALVAAVLGVVCGACMVTVVRARTANFRVEAERNLLRAALSATIVEGERRRVARALAGGVGRELAALVADLEADAAAPGAADVRAVLAELEAVVWPKATTGTRTIASLGEAIAEKCRPLAGGNTYTQALRGEASLDEETCTALVRIAQELVRNAFTHGHARSVHVELAADVPALSLRVRDDGTGLSAEAFARATGGLRNARGRLEELGGRLELVPQDAGTELVATLAAR